MSRQLGAVAGTAGFVALLGTDPVTNDFRRTLAVMAVVALAVAVPARRLP